MRSLKVVFVSLITFVIISFTYAKEKEVEISGLEEALSKLDEAMTILASLKSSPSTQKLIQILAVVRVRVSDTLKTISKKSYPSSYKSNISAPEEVEIKSQLGNGEKTLKLTIIEKREEKGKMLPRYPATIGEKDFADLIFTLKKLSFGSERINLLKDAVKRYYFTTDQVIEVMRVFEFGGEKVEAGSTLYPRVVDKENFFKTNAELEFEGDRESLRKQIEKWDQIGLPPETNK